MKAKRNYYQDPYLTTVSTQVTAVREDKQGTWYAFDNTIFYPEGGGQSADSGWVDGAPVKDVKEIDDVVWHLIEGTCAGSVELKLDWDLRYANMQQHTGQHILSSCFKEMHDINTVSVHLGSEETMIELDCPDISENILAETEARANRIIRENHPVNPLWLDRSDLDKYSLRRTIKSESDEIRLVEIGDFDRVGCGGIHVRSTAEIGLIKITGSEMIRGHVRVKAKIGASAYSYFSELHTALHRIGKQFSSAIIDLPDRVEASMNETRDLAGQIKRITDRWLLEYAKNLESGPYQGCFNLPDLSKDQLKIISEHWLYRNKRPCLFISASEGKINFFIRVPEGSTVDLQVFMKEGREAFALKGGGRADFATGEVDPDHKETFSFEDLFTAFNRYVKERSK